MEGIQRMFDENYQKIQTIAEKFFTQIIQVRKICKNTDGNQTANIIRDLFNFAKSLKSQIEDMKKFRDEISQLCQKTVELRTMHERDQTDKSIKREKLKGDLKEKQKQMADVMETINKTEKDKNDLETQVKETQQTIQKVKNVESAVSKGQWLAGGIAAVSGIVVQFSQKYDTSLLDVIDCAADSHDAMDKSLERLFATLRSLNSSIKALENHTEFLNQHHQKLNEEKERLEVQLGECSVILAKIEEKLKKISQELANLNNIFEKTNTWILTLSRWMKFLDEMQAQTERIPENLDHDDEVFQEITQKVRRQLHTHLNTEEANKLGMEACELAIDTSHVASFEATSLPEVVQPENQDTINDVLNKLENL